MWAPPGKQLLFMGWECGEGGEWFAERGLDWWVLGDEHHAGPRQLVRDLNQAYRDNPPLWALDHYPDGFAWIDANDAGGNALSFLRFAGQRAPDGGAGQPRPDGLGTAAGPDTAARPVTAVAPPPHADPGCRPPL